MGAVVSVAGSAAVVPTAGVPGPAWMVDGGSDSGRWTGGEHGRIAASVDADGSWGCVELGSGTRVGEVDEMNFGGTRSVQTCCTLTFGRGVKPRSGPTAGEAPRENLGRRIMSVQVAGFEVFESLTNEVTSRS